MEVITYKLEDKFSSIEFEEGEELYFGDPCYVVPGWDHDSGNDVWEKLCNKMFHSVTKQHPDSGEVYTSRELDFDDKNNIRVVEIKTSLVGMSGKFHMWSTNHGDGTFPLTFMGTKLKALGVDAGCLSLIPMSVIKGWGTESSARSLGCIVDDHRKAGIYVEEGDMFWGDYNLLTSWDAERDMEEEDSWMECDEESYIC
jgi:hypothetical protein